MIKTGISGTVSQLVDESNCAKTIGSGTLEVLATPIMIALMEQAAWTCVATALDPGMGTVGTLMNVKHLSPTPLGMTVTCSATLTEIDGRRLVFQVKATDQSGLVGEGIHERAIIDEARFLAKANQKAKPAHA